MKDVPGAGGGGGGNVGELDTTNPRKTLPSKPQSTKAGGVELTVKESVEEPMVTAVEEK